MNYARLRHKMNLETPESVTARGIPTTTWYPAGSAFCELKPLAGRELEQARQVVADATHQIRTRWSKDKFKTRDRLLMDGRYFYIESVANVDERNREAILICVERQDNG